MKAWLPEFPKSPAFSTAARSNQKHNQLPGLSPPHTPTGNQAWNTTQMLLISLQPTWPPSRMIFWGAGDLAKSSLWLTGLIRTDGHNQSPKICCRRRRLLLQWHRQNASNSGKAAKCNVGGSHEMPSSSDLLVPSRLISISISARRSSFRPTVLIGQQFLHHLQIRSAILSFIFS